MTPDEWVDMATVLWGSVDSAIASVKATLHSLGDESYLVFGDYRLNPSHVPN